MKQPAADTMAQQIFVNIPIMEESTTVTAESTSPTERSMQNAIEKVFNNVYFTI